MSAPAGWQPEPWTVANPARLARGWTPRFVTDRARMLEMVKLYESLGYETAVDPVRADQVSEETQPGCRECRLVAAGWLHLIYTRPANASAGASSRGAD